jgi:hypothetical protein
VPTECASQNAKKFFNQLRIDITWWISFPIALGIQKDFCLSEKFSVSVSVSVLMLKVFKVQGRELLVSSNCSSRKMAKVIKASREPVTQRIQNDDEKIDRMKARSMVEKARWEMFLRLKTEPLPVVRPLLTRFKDSKCKKCRGSSKKFCDTDDLLMDPVNILETKLMTDNWWNWLKFCGLKMKLSLLLDSLVVLPAQMKMVKDLTINNPEIPVVFIVETNNPQKDLLLINFALYASGVKLPLITANKTAQRDFIEISKLVLMWS